MELEFYTIDRSPDEIADLWDWAVDECHGKLVTDNPYAFGVMATLEYLMGENDFLPQSYQGVFTLDNVLRHRGKKLSNVRNIRNASVDNTLNNGFKRSRPGNPKTLLYSSSPLHRKSARGQGCVNNGDDVVRNNTDNVGSER